MDKSFAAIGSYSTQEGAAVAQIPQTWGEFFTNLKKVLESNPAGTVLSADDAAIIRAYLPVLVGDETKLTEDGGLCGNGRTEFTAEGAGVSIKCNALLECNGVWDRTRMEWNADLALERVGGNATIEKVTYRWRYASFITLSDGNIKVIYNRAHQHTFDDGMNMDAINGGKKLADSFIDISNQVQWGYVMIANVDVTTNEGTLTF